MTMYGNLVKREWRHAVWSDAAAICPDRNGWVLSLAATAFADRKVAPQYGFRSDRMIGVDVDKAVAAHNAAHGRTVLNLPLHEVLAEWHRPVSALNADLLGSVDTETNQRIVAAWLLSPACKNSVLILNVPVGRENGHLGSLMQGYREEHQQQTANFNRAIILFGYVYASLLNRFFCDWTDIMQPGVIEKALVIINKRARSIERSYRAKRQRMDTLVIARPPMPALKSADSFPKARRHIAAKMAHHTMRHNA